jgi:hypothetical protein
VSFLERNNLTRGDYYLELDALCEDLREALNELTEFYRVMEIDTGLTGMPATE